MQIKFRERLSIISYGENADKIQKVTIDYLVRGEMGFKFRERLFIILYGGNADKIQKVALDHLVWGEM